MHIHRTRDLRSFGLDISRAIRLTYQTRLKDYGRVGGQVTRAPEVGNDIQMGRMSWGFLNCLDFPGRQVVSSSFSTNSGEKLSSGPFMRRRSKFADI